MGGSVNVAIRFRNGETVCVERWTNNTPHWFRNLKMFEGDEDHVREYLAMTRNNDYIADPHATGRPQPLQNSEYGLIVWDYMTNTVLDNNDYSTYRRWDAIHFVDRSHDEGSDEQDTQFNLSRKGSGPTDVRLCDELLAFCNSNRVGIITYKRGSDGKFDTDNPLREGPLSPEEAIRRCQEIWWEEWGPNNRFQRGKDKEDWVEVFIDPRPMTYLEFEKDSEGTKAMRAKLKELGFPFTRKEGLNATIPPPPTKKNLKESEKLARELWQAMKRLDEYKAHDGVAFDTLAGSTKSQIIDMAKEMMENPEKVRQFRLAEYLKYSVSTKVMITAS